MKKTLIFEICASFLVVAILAGVNALMGKSLESDNDFSVLSTRAVPPVLVNSHRRHRPHHGHVGRHHERRRPDQPATQGAQPAAQPAAPAPQAATISQPGNTTVPAQPPRVQ